jgi:ribosome-associated translation inhibitor RaiA
MLIEIRTVGFELTEALRRHIECRVESALGWAARKVLRVEVYLSDINGDHGGDDKSCRLVVRLRRLRTLVIADVQRDLYAAVAKAAGRASDGLSREVHRRTNARSRRQTVRRDRYFCPWRRALVDRES